MMANDYLISFFYWCKRENKNAYTSLIFNDSIVGLKKKIQEWIECCKELDRNPLSISVRYVSGGRFGGSAREMLNCTVCEFYDMYKDA